MKQSPLHDVHLQFGAKMVDFAGWQMPVLYKGIIEEHQHTRASCSFFDVSHMGRIRVQGADSESFLDLVCTRKMAGTEPGQCRYSHVCREDGGILDDVIVSRYTEDDWLMVCNASNREKILEWLAKHAAGRKVDLLDTTLDTAMIALQGPLTLELAASAVPVDLSGIKRYRFASGAVMGVSYSVFRSGYTGEDGYEVVVPAGIVKMLVPQLLGTPTSPHEHIRPAGLGARDTLRLEAGMPLYGQEMSEECDSLSAGQGWCVDLSKDFIGAGALRRLKEDGLKVSLVGLELEGRRIARTHTGVMADGTRIGEVTSGTMSTTLGKNIAMASVAVEYAAEGTELLIDFGARKAAARVIPLPFYKRPKR